MNAARVRCWWSPPGSALGRRLTLGDELVIGREVGGEGKARRRHRALAPPRPRYPRRRRPADDRGSRLGERDIPERRACPRPPGAQGGRLRTGWLDDTAVDRWRPSDPFRTSFGTLGHTPGHAPGRTPGRAARRNPARRALEATARGGGPRPGPGQSRARGSPGLRICGLPGRGGGRPWRHGGRLQGRGARASAPSGAQADRPRVLPGGALPRTLSARIDGSLPRSTTRT